MIPLPTAMLSKILAVLLALALAALGVQTLRLAGERAAHAETKEKHAMELKTLAEAARQAVEAARTEEQRRTAEVQKAADEAEQNLARARADAAAAADAGQRLRDRLATLTASRCRPAGNPSPAGPSQAADPTADMLADVQRRLDEATDGIARFADQARAAGLACQRSYQSLTIP